MLREMKNNKELNQDPNDIIVKETHPMLDFQKTQTVEAMKLPHLIPRKPRK